MRLHSPTLPTPLLLNPRLLKRMHQRMILPDSAFRTSSIPHQPCQLFGRASIPAIVPSSMDHRPVQISSVFRGALLSMRSITYPRPLILLHKHPPIMSVLPSSTLPSKVSDDQRQTREPPTLIHLPTRSLHPFVLPCCTTRLLSRAPQAQRCDKLVWYQIVRLLDSLSHASAQALGRKY
jgi:hypothetical protein